MRKVILFFCFSVLFTGCAVTGILDPSYSLQIMPQPVYRGKPALAEVNIPLDAQQVVGTVDVMGSPQLIFRKNEQKGIWYFYGSIPFSPWVNPGVYQVRVTAVFDHGPSRYTEAKVELR